eukprot:gene5355-7429_t
MDRGKRRLSAINLNVKVINKIAHTDREWSVFEICLPTATNIPMPPSSNILEKSEPEDILSKESNEIHVKFSTPKINENEIPINETAFNDNNNNNNNNSNNNNYSPNFRNRHSNRLGGFPSENKKIKYYRKTFTLKALYTYLLECTKSIDEEADKIQILRQSSSSSYGHNNPPNISVTHRSSLHHHQSSLNNHTSHNIINLGSTYNMNNNINNTNNNNQSFNAVVKRNTEVIPSMTQGTSKKRNTSINTANDNSNRTGRNPVRRYSSNADAMILSAAAAAASVVPDKFSGKFVDPQTIHDGETNTPSSINPIVPSAVSELSLRDLRRLDVTQDQDTDKTIMIRRHILLISLDPLKAFILSDRLIIILPQVGNYDNLIEIIKAHTQEWIDTFIKSNRTNSMSWDGTFFSKQNSIKNGQLSKQYNDILSLNTFELHSLEAFLATIKVLEKQEYEIISNEISKILSCFARGSLLSQKIQEDLRDIKNCISLMKERLTKLKLSLNDLIEEPEDMALMNLSFLRIKPKRYKLPLTDDLLTKYDAIEKLLEGYLVDFNSIESDIIELDRQIETAEDHLKLTLETNENQLLIANTFFIILTTISTFGGYVSGMFATNLDQVNIALFTDDKVGLFYIVIGFLFFISLMGFPISYYIMLPNQK